MFSFIRAALVMVSFTAIEQRLRHRSVNSRASNSAGPSGLCVKPFCPPCFLSSPLYFLIFGVHLYLSVGHIYNTVLFNTVYTICFMITYFVGQFWLPNHLSLWCCVWFLAELSGCLSLCHGVCGAVRRLVAADHYGQLSSSWGIFTGLELQWRLFLQMFFFLSFIYQHPNNSMPRNIRWRIILFLCQKEYICRKGSVVERKQRLPPFGKDFRP